jgi:Reverse transcriptase (RNA-dependent DNA polymerase)
MWNQHLLKGLSELGFEQSKADECVFFQAMTIFMVYVDNGILIDPDNSQIDKALSDLQSKFKVQDEGNLSDYLGVKVTKHPDGSIEFAWPQLIDFDFGRSELGQPWWREEHKDLGYPKQTQWKSDPRQGRKIV